MTAVHEKAVSTAEWVRSWEPFLKALGEIASLTASVIQTVVRIVVFCVTHWVVTVTIVGIIGAAYLTSRVMDALGNNEERLAAGAAAAPGGANLPPIVEVADDADARAKIATGVQAQKHVLSLPLDAPARLQAIVAAFAAATRVAPPSTRTPLDQVR